MLDRLMNFLFDSKSKSSASNPAIVIESANSLVSNLNKLLKTASESKNIPKRETMIIEVRQILEKITQISIKHPAIKLTNLENVKSSINKVEAETQLMRNNADGNSADGTNHQFSQNDKKAIIECIQSQFRVINESIEIARKSKNIDTKKSRIDVARNTLKRAREQAAQFSLTVDGFEQAETAINRIHEALKSGTQEKILDTLALPIDMSMSNAARDLLKEATALKKEKKYAEACEKLREAYSSDGAENLMIEERLRLPMYLLLAGRNDEGWDELNRLNVRYADQFSQPIIANQMRVFRKKEGKNRAAVPGVMDDLNNEVFWADKIKEFRGEPVKRLTIAMDNLPLPAAFREAAVALRTLIRLKRKEKESFVDELSLLYWFSAINSFSIPYSSYLQQPGYNVIESMPVKVIKTLPFTYFELGYEKLELLNKTDIKWCIEAWGEPQGHTTLHQIHNNIWQKYEKELSAKQKKKLNAMLAKL